MNQSDIDALFSDPPTDIEIEPEVQKEFDDAIESDDISGLSAAQLETLLHELVARRLVEAMRRGDPGAGLIQAARGFLRDNEVSGLDLPGSAQTALREQLTKNAPFKLTGTK